MKKLTSMLFLLIVTFTTTNVIAAVKIVECEDEKGNRAFHKMCPPGTKMVGEKKLSTGQSDKKKDDGATNINATLYFVPDCDTCEEVKEFLQNRNIAITEKMVNKDLKIQTELTELTGGLKVPTAVIGESVIVGYNRAELKAALEAAGYKEDNGS